MIDNLNQNQALFCREIASRLSCVTEMLEDGIKQNRRHIRQTACKEVLQLLHTIKGTARIFGFDCAGDFAQSLENFLIFTDENQVELSNGLIRLIISSCKHIGQMIEDPGGNSYQSCIPIIEGLKKEILNELDNHPDAGIEDACLALSLAQDSKLNLYWIRFHPSSHFFLNKLEPLSVINIFREMGEATVIVQTDYVPHLPKINPMLCYLFWDILLTTDKDIERILGKASLDDDQAIVIKKITSN